MPKACKKLKKLVSIFLLLVFLFNVGGYYFVFWCMQHQAREKLLHRFDSNNYQDHELVVLSFPITLPYPVSSDEPTRATGKFQYNGKEYRLVQQRFENDTLFVICIKDTESMRIASAINEYIQIANDLPGTNQALGFLGKLYKDFNTTTIIAFTPFNDPVEPPQFFSFSSSALPDPFHRIESPPPQFVF
ncbi:MAG TPA: hypothetical protein VD884_12870 [Ohtaekwangia sp.]|nr:hypothetical protein [Ohtaekwangia sp.]